MREIAKEVDRFLVGVLREAGVEETCIVGAIGALAPRPPGYAEPLLELIQRLAGEPLLARDLPRLADSYLAAEHGSDEPEAARLLRLVAAFVEKQGRVPAELVAPLRWRPAESGEALPTATPVDEPTQSPVEMPLFPDQV